MDETTLQIARSEALLQMHHKADAAKQELIQAYEFYKNELKENQHLTPYQRGQLHGRVWEIEQIFGHHGLFLSTAGQDIFIYNNFFKNKKNGIYLEVGGYNGWRGSNCYFFEKTLDWQGVIVEASPTQVKNIAQYRNAKIIHAALSDSDGVAQFIDMVGGLTQMSGLVEHLSENGLQKVRNYTDHQEQYIEVPTMTLNSLLDLEKLTHIDYCSIDVEGAERAILSKFDFDRYDISVFSVENNTSNTASSVSDILIPAGYRVVGVVGADEIYIKNTFHKK